MLMAIHKIHRSVIGIGAHDEHILRLMLCAAAFNTRNIINRPHNTNKQKASTISEEDSRIAESLEIAKEQKRTVQEPRNCGTNKTWKEIK